MMLVNLNENVFSFTIKLLKIFHEFSVGSGDLR